MKKIITSIILVGAFFVCAYTSESHSGRTDSNGGHRDNINGGYHYHNSGSSGFRSGNPFDNTKYYNNREQAERAKKYGW